MGLRELARLCAALAAPFLVASVALAGPKKMEIAVEDESAGFRGDDSPLAERTFQRVVALGASHVRVDVWWHPELPQGEQDAMLEQSLAFVQRVEAHHLVPQVTVSTIAAAWGNYSTTPGVRAGGVDPSLDGFLAFLVRVVTTLHAAGVNRFSIWNEPNHPGFLLAGPEGKTYYDGSVALAALEAKKPLSAADKKAERDLRRTQAALWKKIIRHNVEFMRKAWVQGYDAIKAIDPKIQVLVGELSSGERSEGSFGAIRFLTEIVNGSKHEVHADGIAIHPYQFETRPESSRGLPAGNCGISQLGDLQKVLEHLRHARRFARADGKRVPVFLTEFGYRLHEKRRDWPAVRAKWTARAFAVAEKARVAEMLYYQLLPTQPGHGTWDTSMLDQNGGSTPVFHALEKWVHAFEKR